MIFCLYKSGFEHFGIITLVKMYEASFRYGLSCDRESSDLRGRAHVLASLVSQPIVKMSRNYSSLTERYFPL